MYSINAATKFWCVLFAVTANGQVHLQGHLSQENEVIYGKVKEDGATLAPTPCCVPDQYEGKFSTFARTVKETKGDDPENRKHPKPIDSATFGTLHFDYTNKQVAVNEVVYVGKDSLNLTIIALFQKNTLYVADLNKRICRKIIMGNGTSEMKGHCIPPNATYIGNPTFGLLSTGLKTNAWAVAFKQGRVAEFQASVVTTSRGCVPMLEMANGRVGRRKIGFTASYFDNTLGIASKSAFTPPSFCNTNHVDWKIASDEDILKFTGDEVESDLSNIGLAQEYFLLYKYAAGMEY